MRLDQLFIYHSPYVFIVEGLDLHDLVAAAESVEEMHEWHPGFQCCRRSDERQIVYLLDARRSNQAPACTAGGHYV